MKLIVLKTTTTTDHTVIEKLKSFIRIMALAIFGSFLATLCRRLKRGDEPTQFLKEKLKKYRYQSLF